MSRELIETLNCVRCGKRAKMWGGHVDYWVAMVVKAKKRKKPSVKVVHKSVLAGWCSDQCHYDTGFSGTYQPWMGKHSGKHLSPCKIITSPKRDNMTHITWDKFYLSMGIFLTGEGLALLVVTPYLAFGLSQVAFGLYVIFTNNKIKSML